jgi:hypothetical protein
LTTAQIPEGSSPVAVAEEVTTYKSEESNQDDSADGKQQKAEEFQSGEL